MTYLTIDWTDQWRHHKSITPIYDNQGDGSSYEGYHTLSDTIDLGVQRGNIRNQTSGILLHPTENPYNSLCYNKQSIPLNVDHTGVKNHTIDGIIGNTRFCVLEHILSISTGLQVHFDIEVYGNSANIPFFSDGIEFISKKVAEHLSQHRYELQYFTVNEPEIIQFDSGAYIIILPDNGDKKLKIDAMVDYPGKSIGKQRIITEINPKLFIDQIAPARTNASGWREKYVSTLEKYPILRNIWLNSGYHNVLAFTPDKIINPQKQYKEVGGIYSELIWHVVQDKMGALGIDISRHGVPGNKFVGTLVIGRSSHANDLEMMRMFQNEDIETVDVE